MRSSADSTLNPVRGAPPALPVFCYVPVVSRCSATPAAGLLLFAQRLQVGGEVVSRAEGVGVVVAEDGAAAGEGVLVEFAGLLVFAQLAQVGGEVAGRAEGVGVV